MIVANMLYAFHNYEDEKSYIMVPILVRLAARWRGPDEHLNVAQLNETGLVSEVNCIVCGNDLEYFVCTCSGL